MITVPFINVTLKLDNSTSPSRSVPPHELALLNVMYGAHKVTENGLHKNTKEVDLMEEYERLKRRYGINKERKIPWVEVAFGMFHEGRFETVVMKGIAHYSTQKPAEEAELTPAQKAARTRAANKAAKEAEKADAEDAVAAA